MNQEHIQTFLDIVETGNFNKTAERLNITQSTVSGRIRSLENSLDNRLFERGRFGAILTPAGQRFRSYAAAITQKWNQARQELALPMGYKGMIRLSTQMSLWDRFVNPWILWLRETHPEIAVYVEADYSKAMLEQIGDGTLDIAVMYYPRFAPDLHVEPLDEESFVMIGTRPWSLSDLDAENYIYVDWSPAFREQHGDRLPGLHTSAVSMGLGVMALDYARNRGGALYYPERSLASLLCDGFHRIEEAPILKQPVYAVYPASLAEESKILIALDGLKKLAETTPSS